MDIEEQYDKIYRYCYFRLHSREAAEDATQETFFRYLEHYNCVTTSSALKCLYTIARNLCIDEYRKAKPVPAEEETAESDMEEKLLTTLTVRKALSELSPDDQELLLLRYVNGVPVAAVVKILGISRFSVYRRLAAASKKFREALRKEDIHE